MKDACEAVDLIKIKPAVMYSLYHFDLSEDQEDDSCEELIELLKDFYQGDESRGGSKTVLGTITDKLGIVDKFFGFLGGDKK